MWFCDSFHRVLSLLFLLVLAKNASSLVKVSCSYYTSSGNVPQYQCKLTSSNMANENEKIEDLEKFNEIRPFVSRIANDGALSYIPVGLFSAFPNVSQVYLEYNSNLKEISINSFKNAFKLKTLQINNLQSDTLPDKVFQDSADLESITFYNGKIANFSANVFDGVEKLNLSNLAPIFWIQWKTFPFRQKLQFYPWITTKLRTFPRDSSCYVRN